MTPEIILVLRSGGDYHLGHVCNLVKQVSYPVRLLSDRPADHMGAAQHLTPMFYKWPGWWSKLEVFRLANRCLYMDLDTVVVGDLTPLVDAARANPEKLIVLRDFYRPNRIGSGLMAWSRDLFQIYSTFLSEPERYMKKYRKEGDQGFIQEAVKKLDIPIAYWQDLLPEHTVASYKVHVRGQGLHSDTSVVCFHGKPRPWEINDEWAKKTQIY